MHNPMVKWLRAVTGDARQCPAHARRPATADTDRVAERAGRPPASRLQDGVTNVQTSYR